MYKVGPFLAIAKYILQFYSFLIILQPWRLKNRYPTFKQTAPAAAFRIKFQDTTRCFIQKYLPIVILSIWPNHKIDFIVVICSVKYDDVRYFFAHVILQYSFLFRHFEFKNCSCSSLVGNSITKKPILHQWHCSYINAPTCSETGDASEISNKRS